MKKVLFIIAISVSFLKLSAQNNTTSQSTGKLNNDIQVNHEMIRRFHEVKTEGDVYSWSQFFTRSGSNDVSEILRAYASCNLGEESLVDIQLALEEKARQNDESSELSPDAYYAYINRIKQEINEKLLSNGSMALK